MLVVSQSNLGKSGRVSMCGTRLCRTTPMNSPGETLTGEVLRDLFPVPLLVEQGTVPRDDSRHAPSHVEGPCRCCPPVAGPVTMGRIKYTEILPQVCYTRAWHHDGIRTCPAPGVARAAPRTARPVS